MTLLDKIMADPEVRVASVILDIIPVLIAADALDDAADAVIGNAERLGDYADPQVSLPLSCIKDLTTALAAYRKAIGEA